MKKSIIILLFLIASSLLFAGVGDERSWFYNGEHLTTIDLTQAYYLPKFETVWVKSTDPNNTTSPSTMENGTFNAALNGIGNVGYAYCSHYMYLTVDTNGGRFICQSDHTKYRDFYIALVPRYRKKGASSDISYRLVLPVTNTVANFESDASMKALTDRVPSTRNGTTVTVVGPNFKNVNKTASSVLNSLPSNATTVEKLEALRTAGIAVISTDLTESLCLERVWWDLLVCMDPITSEDMIHLIDSDDYLATITFTLTCEDPTCTNPEHHKIGTIQLRGKYNKKGHEGSNVFLVVTPVAAATRLDLKSMINSVAQSNNTAEETIAQLELTSSIRKYEANKTNTVRYEEHVMVFISSSPDYSTSGSTFSLKRYYPTNDSKEIPFTIKVYKKNTNTLVKEFYGDENYVGSSSASTCLPLLDFIVYNNKGYRDGDKTNQVDLSSDVKIAIKDAEITESGQTAWLSDLIEAGEYSGLYRTNIYYHLIWQD